MMNKIKNIIIVCEYAQPSGGSQSIAINSAIELAKRGYHVVFFTAIGKEYEELKNSNVQVKHLHIKNITEEPNLFKAAIRGLWNQQAVNEIEKLLNNYEIESTIVHIHNWSNAFSSAIVRKVTKLGYKTVVTLHDYLIICPNGGFYDYKHNHICVFEPMSIRCMLCNCDRRSYSQKIYRIVREVIQNFNIRYNKNLNLITISQLNDKLIRTRVKSKNIYRINNFVQIKPRKKIERKGNFNFVFVGRVVKEKGADIFCKAITSLKEKHPEICGQILGDGPLMNQLKESYPAIDFRGWVSHSVVDDVMANARCLIFPSVLYEASPLTVIEAFSSGLPCIASNCTTANEFITDSVNGYLFEAGSVNSLVQKMEESLIDDKYVTIEKNIKDTFNPAKYSCSAYIDNILEVYNRIEVKNE